MLLQFIGILLTSIDAFIGYKTKESIMKNFSSGIVAFNILINGFVLIVSLLI